MDIIKYGCIFLISTTHLAENNFKTGLRKQFELLYDNWSLLSFPNYIDFSVKIHPSNILFEFLALNQL